MEYTGINESIKTPEDLIPATMIEQDEDHMFITQIEREDWNNKANKTLDNVELDRAFWKNSFADAWGYYCLPNGLRFQWNTATFFNGAATRNVYLSYSVNAPICVMASIIKTDETVNLDVRVKFVNSSTLNISVKRNDGMGLSGNTTITYFVIETIQEYK